MIYSDVKVILYRKLDRRGLLDFISRDSVLEADPQGAFDVTESALSYFSVEVRSGDVVLIWREADRLSNGTPAIVVRDEDYVDFLAWCSTYIGTFTPFTAFFRVIRRSELDRFDLLIDRKLSIPRPILDKMAAVAVAEAAVQTGFRSSKLSALSLQSCQLTFAFTAVRGLNAGLHPAQLIELAEAWTNARRAGSDRPLALSAERATTFWLLASSSLLQDRAVQDEDTWMGFLSSFIQSVQNNTVEKWNAPGRNRFVEIARIIQRYELSRELPREQQLRRIDESVKELSRLEMPVPLVEAVLGYLIARLSNGSFDYLALAGEYQRDLPCTALWFAFFSIWQKGYDGLAAGASLGRHVARLAESSLEMFDYPTADISLQEYLIFADRKSPTSVLSSNNSTIEIELMPGVSGVFPKSVRREDEVIRSPPAFDVPRLRRALYEALSVIEQPSRNDAELRQPALNDLFPRQSAGSNERPKKSPKRKSI